MWYSYRYRNEIAEQELLDPSNPTYICNHQLNKKLRCLVRKYSTPDRSQLDWEYQMEQNGSLKRKPVRSYQSFYSQILGATIEVADGHLMIRLLESVDDDGRDLYCRGYKRGLGIVGIPFQNAYFK